MEHSISHEGSIGFDAQDPILPDEFKNQRNLRAISIDQPSTLETSKPIDLRRIKEPTLMSATGKINIVQNLWKSIVDKNIDKKH